MAYKDLSASAVAKLSLAQITAMTAANWREFSLTQFSALTGAQLSAVSAALRAGWTQSQIEALSASSLAGMTPATFSLTVDQAGWLETKQVKALKAPELAALTGAELRALHGLTQSQALKLDAAALGRLSAAQFTTLVAPVVDKLSAAQLKGLTTAELSSLTSLQAFSLTPTQYAAFSAKQKAGLAAMDPELAAVEAKESGGALSYRGALSVLQTAATGGITASEFGGLTALAEAIGAGVVKATAYVEQIFDDVVFGSSANAWWTGGGTTRVALGDLSAGSTRTQANELIDKWFLGSDLPQTDSDYTYQNDGTTTLYGSSGAPQMGDVNQGGVGDCYFLAALAEVADKDPTAIENMIHANGNGTWSVEFQVNGKADYVTVNADFQHLPAGWTYAGGNTAFDGGAGTLWGELIEKAFVQLNEQAGAGDGTAVNSYDGVSGGWGEGLAQITGQSYSTYATSSGEAGTSVANLLTVLQKTLAGGEEVLMGTTNGTPPTGSNLVADHMYSVLAVNASAGTVELRNPWGGSGAIFTDAASYLTGDGVTFLAATGKSALG